MAKQADDGKGMLFLELATEGGKPPAEVQLLPFGVNKTDKGTFTLDKPGAEMVMQFHKTTKNDAVIDYEHQTEDDVIAPAAGWITELVNKGEAGIWGKVNWCKRAADMVGNREYRYLSPVFYADAKGRILKFCRAALTNAPSFDGMQPIVAKQEVPGGNAETQKTTEETITMKTILEALGLAATATETEAIAAISAMKTAAGNIPVACKGVLTALGLTEKANESEIVGTIIAMKSGSDKTPELATQVKSLSDKLAARDAEELVQVAMKAGKISPAQSDWAKNYASTDPEGFKVFAAKAPVVVALGANSKEPAPKAEGEELNAAELVACKQLGISREDFLKHNKKA